MRKQIAPIVLMALLGQIEATRLMTRDSHSQILAQSSDPVAKEGDKLVTKPSAADLDKLMGPIGAPPAVKDKVDDKLVAKVNAVAT